jgi:hypothetical protein
LLLLLGLRMAVVIRHPSCILPCHQPLLLQPQELLLPLAHSSTAAITPLLQHTPGRPNSSSIDIHSWL